MRALVLPVGHDLGAFHPGGAADPVRQVRLGAALVELSDPEIRAWTLAHGRTDDDASVIACTDDVLRAQVDDGVVDALCERGLLAVVAPGSSGARDFAERHRLLPLAMGLGNSAQEPWLFGLGLLYQPLAVVSGPLFDLWQWAHLSPDLWSACTEVAEVALHSGVEDTELTDPEQVLTGSLTALHHLVGSRVACLDVRVGGLS